MGLKHVALSLTALTGLMLAGCATGPAPADPDRSAPPVQDLNTPLRALPPQTLETGRCGLFLFGVAEPYPFIVFEDEAARRVKILHAGEIHDMGVAVHEGAFAPSVPFRRVYTHVATNRVFTLTGRVGSETGSGPRLNDVLLRVREPDGMETVRPLGGVYSCRQAPDPRALNRR